MNHKNKNSDMLPITSYSLFIRDLPPRLGGKALEKIARNDLIGLYPGKLDDCTLFIKRNNRKKGSYLVFVLDKELPKKPLPVSTLFIMKYFCGKNARALFVDSNCMEFIVIKNGALESSVKLRNDAVFKELINQFFDEENKKLDVFCRGDDAHLFRDNKCDFDITIHLIEDELDKFPSYTYSLFDHLSIERRIQKLILFFLVLFVMGGTVCYFYIKHQMDIEAIFRNRSLEEAKKLRDEEARNDKRRILELQERYRRLIEHRTAGPYETMDTISRCLDDKVRISSITIKDGFFQMEAQASDSLEILKLFEDTFKVRNPMLQQIHPLKNGESFTISGTVVPEKESLDTLLSLSTREQIVNLNELIAKEENKNQGKLRPSDFGVNIRGLLARWGCFINSYQYLTIGNDREIEFSIKATSNNFFSFLREASINNNGWIFTLVQIRNLAPQNAVDGLFRVRAETIVEDGMDTIEPYKEGPASGISRHFYTPPPPQPQIIKTSPVSIPPSPPPPTPVKPEPAPSWLAYIGATSDDSGSQFIHVKNTRNGIIHKLEYTITPMGTIVVQIEGKLYEITRR